MTPKEKAAELINKYLDTAINFPYIDSQDGACIGSGYMTHQSARQCATIAVDEILHNIEATILYHEDSKSLPLNKLFWQQVKQEIQDFNQ